MYRKIITTLLTIVITVGIRYCASNQFDNTSRSTKASSFTTSVTNTKLTPRKQAPVKFEKQSVVLIKHLYDGEYDQIENLLTEAIDNAYITRGGSYYAITMLNQGFRYYTDYFDQNWINAFNTWVKQNPDSSIAYTTRAVFYNHYGWKLRGNAYANKTSKEAIEQFHYYLTLSYEDTIKALELDPNNPIALENMLSIGIGLSMPREQFEQVFQLANNEFAYMINSYQQKAEYLNPKWYGSEAELLAFARAAVKNAPKNTAIPLILVQAHESLSNNYPDTKAYYNRPEVWQEIEENYLKIISNFPQSGVYAIWYAQTAKEAGKDQISREYALEALKREPNNPIIKQMAANIGVINN